MKSVFIALILAACVALLIGRLYLGVIDFLNEVTRQPGRHVPERNND